MSRRTSQAMIAQVSEVRAAPSAWFAGRVEPTVRTVLCRYQWVRRVLPAVAGGVCTASRAEVLHCGEQCQAHPQRSPAPFFFLHCRRTPGLSGAGPRALECKQDAPSRVRSRPFVRALLHLMVNFKPLCCCSSKAFRAASTCCRGTNTRYASMSATIRWGIPLDGNTLRNVRNSSDEAACGNVAISTPIGVSCSEEAGLNTAPLLGGPLLAPSRYAKGFCPFLIFRSVVS